MMFCSPREVQRINTTNTFCLCHKAAGTVLQTGEVTLNYSIQTGGGSVFVQSSYVLIDMTDYIFSRLKTYTSYKETGVGHFRRVCLSLFEDESGKVKCLTGCGSQRSSFLL